MREDQIRVFTSFARENSVPIPNSGNPARKLSAFDNLMAVTRKSHQFQIKSPQLFIEEKYATIYQKIQGDVQKTQKYLVKQGESKEKQKVKRSINKIIHLNSEQEGFNQRFAMTQKGKNIVSKRLKKAGIGLTNLQKQAENRKYFFTDHKKVIELEQECMLLQYFLKDQQKQKNPTQYLRDLSKTSQHRRLTPSISETQKLHITHDQRLYRSLKKRVHLKQQFVEKCSDFAKKNSSYRRRQNFKQIQYVLKHHNQSLIDQTIVPSQESVQEKLKLLNNNKMLRLYLHYDFTLIKGGANSQKTLKSFGLFKEDLYKIESSFEVKQFEIIRKFDTIMQYKKDKSLYFQDFKQLLVYLNDIFKKDILQLFQNKFPQYFMRKKDQILKNHWNQIDRHLTGHKVKFLLQTMFNSFPEKIIGRQIIPIKIIPTIFKAYGISQKDFKLSQLYLNYQWMQRHEAGLTFQEFYKGSILMGMKGEDWKGIQSFLKKINLKQHI